MSMSQTTTALPSRATVSFDHGLSMRAENRARRRRQEAREARVLEAALFPLFLGTAVAARCLGKGRDAGQPSRGIIADARARAGEVIPFVFVR